LDIIIEGVITKEEGMNEVVETIIHLKSVPSALLRVSCKEASLQGRVGFGPGGYILGGCIDDTGETGYAAVKKLLTVKSGNYAVLDMTNEYVPEINQTLWLKGDKVVEIWPNLPDSPDSLLGASLSSIPALQNINQLNPEDREDAINRIRRNYSRSKAHEAQITKYHLALKLSWLLITLILVMVVVKYGYILVSPFFVTRHSLIK